MLECWIFLAVLYFKVHWVVSNSEESISEGGRGRKWERRKAEWACRVPEGRWPSPKNKLFHQRLRWGCPLAVCFGQSRPRGLRVSGPQRSRVALTSQPGSLSSCPSLQPVAWGCPAISGISQKGESRAPRRLWRQPPSRGPAPRKQRSQTGARSWSCGASARWLKPHGLQVFAPPPRRRGACGLLLSVSTVRCSKGSRPPVSQQKEQ